MQKLLLFGLLLGLLPPTLAQNPDNFILVKGREYPFSRDNVMIELSDFYISPTEVSYRQMAMYALDNGIDPQTFHYKSWGEPDGERVAIDVNWFDAIRYANWLSEQQGYTPVYQFFSQLKSEDGSAKWQALSPADSLYWLGEYKDDNELGLDSIAWDRTAQGYRLPTEAEWEYAASGYSQLGRKQKWAGTDDPQALKDYARYYGNSKRAEKIASRKPNPLGLYDMSGNAWEWCFDTYKGSYENFENKKNPANSKYDNLRTSGRCLRGGSWDYDVNNSEVLYRSNFYPRNRYNNYGFRLLRTP
jgi:formylglycine-generating enzyme